MTLFDMQEKGGGGVGGGSVMARNTHQADV